LGGLSAINLAAGQYVDATVALYFVTRLFFQDRVNVWWYNLVPFALLTAIALLGTGVFAVICSALPLAGFTTRNCNSFDVLAVLKLHVLMLNFVGGLVWFSFSAVICWRRWRH
jgi:hypothetical protein